MKIKHIVLLALLSFSSVSMAASLVSMNNKQAKTALSDKTITTVTEVTLNGQLVENTFTGYFNKDGSMVGKLANAPADGGPQNDKGTWKVQANGQVCVTWQNWNKAQPRCVMLYNLTNALLIVGPGNNFETLVLNNNIQSGNQVSS